jgi:putative transposase
MGTMGRLPRATADGLVYHAMNRGNNGADVFAGDGDYEAFLESLRIAKGRYPFALFGYCLMSNHFHLLLKPRSGQSISRILQSLTVAHTWRYHKQHDTSGHVWQGRFRSPVIQDDDHLLVVLRYIEANPIRAGMIADLRDYRWSSYGQHGMGLVDTLLDGFPEWEQLGSSPAERRQRWRAKLRSKQKQDELTAIRDSLRTGRPLGSPAWVGRVAGRLGIDLTPRPRGRPRKLQAVSAIEARKKK